MAAALLLKDEIVHPGESTPSPSRNKIVALINVNKPLNELANRMHQLCGGLGLTRKDTDGSEVPRVVIRMFRWSYEKISAQHIKLEDEREELLGAVLVPNLTLQNSLMPSEELESQSSLRKEP